MIRRLDQTTWANGNVRDKASSTRCLIGVEHDLFTLYAFFAYVIAMCLALNSLQPLQSYCARTYIVQYQGVFNNYVPSMCS